MAVTATSLAASLALLLLLCSCVKASHEHYYVTVGSDIGLRNDSFLYAQCQEKPGNCTVSIERVGTSEVRSCNLQLLGDKKWQTLIKLRRFDDNKIVVNWMSYDEYDNNMYIGVINMFNCSLSHHVQYHLSRNLQIFPALYRKGFDIFVEKNETICAGTDSPSCRVSFDMEGRQIGDPVPFGIDLMMTNVWTIAADSPDKGFFVAGYKTVRGSNNSIALKIVEPMGKVVDLVMGKEAVSKTAKLVHAASNDHGYLGICWRSPSDEFSCRQFDAEGKFRLNASGPILPIEELLGAHNLAEGGILVITEIRGNHAFRVRKIDASGILVKEEEVSHRCYSPERLFWIYITETEEEFIFYFSCWGYKNIGRDLVDSSVLRLPKKDFI